MRTDEVRSPRLVIYSVGGKVTIFIQDFRPKAKNLFDYVQICRGIYAHAKRAGYNGRDLLYACPCVFWGPLDVGAWVVGTCIIQHVRTKTNGGAHILGSVVQTGQNANSFSIVFLIHLT